MVTQEQIIIRELHSDEEILATFEVMHLLRPHLEQEHYLLQVKRMMQQGFRLAGVNNQDRIVAVAGFRIIEYLAKGKHIYLDDLVTLESERSTGYGHAMMDWLYHVGAEHGCDFLYLDSGVQRNRAHRFYFREGMHIMAYHFCKKIG